MLIGEQLRLKFNELGFTYSMITSREISKLMDLLKIELDKYNLNDIDGLQLKISKLSKCDFFYDYNLDGSITKVLIKVDGYYFKDREAISFNRDGFIGFCGWASSKNAMPIYDAFDKWLEFLKNN